MSQGSAGKTGDLVGGVYNVTPPVLTDGQQIALQTDSSGNLNVAIGGSSGGNVSTNIAQYGGTNVGPTNPFNVTGATSPLSTSLDWFYAGATGGITNTSDVVLVAAAGANLYNTCSSLQFLNTSTTATEIVIKDGSTIIWRGYAEASVAAVTQPGMITVTFSPPLRSSANAALNFACITTSSATRISAQGSVVG